MPSGFFVVVFEYAGTPVRAHCYNPKFSLAILEGFLLLSFATVEVIVLSSAVVHRAPQERRRSLPSRHRHLVSRWFLSGDPSSRGTGWDSHRDCFQLRDTSQVQAFTFLMICREEETQVSVTFCERVAPALSGRVRGR